MDGNMEQAVNNGSFVYTESTMEEGCNHGNFQLTKPINLLPMTSKSEEEDEACLKGLPPGYRFKPLDFELLVWYLKRKVYNKPLPPNRIKEVQLYNFDPKTLTEMSNNKSFNGIMDEWYFFTPRDRKYRNGSRPSRRAGEGFWKATGADKHVKYNGNLVGLKKTLVYCKGKQPHGEKTNWIMNEYVLSNPPARERATNDDMRLDDWVLCRVYQNLKEAKPKPGETPERDTNQKQEEAEAAIPAPHSDTQIPPPQYHQQFQDFNTPPQQTYPMPMPFYHNAFDNFTSPMAFQNNAFYNSTPPMPFHYNAFDYSTPPMPFHHNAFDNSTPPMSFHNNAFDNSSSTSAGVLPALPESFDPILEPASTIFPPEYGNFIPSVGPIVTSVPPEEFHSMGHDNLCIHQQQQQQQQQVSNFSIDSDQFLDIDSIIDFGSP